MSETRPILLSEMSQNTRAAHDADQDFIYSLWSEFSVWVGRKHPDT